MSVALALRLGRWGIVGFALAAVFLTFINAAGFYQIAGHTPAERAAFGNSMLQLASQFAALLPPPIRPDTVAGYVEFRGFHPLAILFGVWALASATGFARADEERGLVEVTLATGISRLRLIASRVIAFAIATSIAAAAAAAGYIAGASSGHDVVGGAGVVQACALLVAISLANYTIALFVSQIFPTRLATGAAGAVLLALFLLNGLSRVFSSLTTWRWLSPFRYYDLSQPLPPGGFFDTRAFIALLGIAAVAGVAASLAFQRRDLGAALVSVPTRTHRASHDASSSFWWKLPVIRGLYEDRLGIAAWAVGLGVIAMVLASLAKTIVQVLLSVPSFLPYLSIFVRTQVYPGVLGFTWLNVAQLLFAGFAIAHVARWAAEDSDGRLEAALSQPVSRATLVLERMATLAAGAVIVAAVSAVALYYQSHVQGIDLNPARLMAASLMLVPFALVFTGAGSLLASWNPRAAVGLLGGFAFASYLDTELGNIFRLPLWLQDLSAFKLFGTPLLTGVDWRSLSLMLALAVAGVAASILLMQRRDVGA